MSQPTAEERAMGTVARSLTNAALAQRLGIVRDSVRSVSRLERDAYLDEAIRRLNWTEDYMKHTELEIVPIDTTSEVKPPIGGWQDDVLLKPSE